MHYRFSMKVSICETFSQLAANTWNYLDEGSRIGLSPGEETLTDLNLFEIARRHFRNVLVAKSSKKRESQQGFDWEFWIGNYNQGWCALRIQAKKIDTSSFNVYSGLDYSPASVPSKNVQIHNLIKSSKSDDLYPMYCFYNTRLQKPSFWGCCLSHAEVVLNKLENAQTLGNNCVAFSELEPFMFPWHELVCIDTYLYLYEPNTLNDYPNIIKNIVDHRCPPAQSTHFALVKNDKLPYYIQQMLRRRDVDVDEGSEIELPVRCVVLISDLLLRR